MKRKLLLSTLLAVLFLSSCTKAEPPKGSIGNVEVSVQIEEDETPVFEKVENKLNYLTREFDDPRARVSFEIPTDWAVSVMNERMYQITSPGTDIHLPGLAILVSHKYNVQDNFIASNLSQVFSEEITKYTYRISGENYFIVDMPSPSKMVDGASFSDDVSFSFYEDVTFMKSNKTAIYGGTLNMINAYVTKPYAPTLISAVFHPGLEEDVLAELEYMISSMKPLSSRLDSISTFNIGNYSFSAYSDLVKTGSYLKPSGLSPLSGVSVGVFQFGDDIDSSNISGFAGRMVSEMLGLEGVMSFASLVDDESYLTGVPVLKFDGSASYIQKGKEDTYYGYGGNIYYTVYVMKRDKTHAVMVTYEQDQMDIGKALCEIIEQTLKYN